MNDNIFETLNELTKNQRKHSKDNSFVSNSPNVTMKESNCKRKDPSYIYLEDNQVKERKLSELLDSSASVYINRTMNYESAKLIHEFMFGK